MVSIFNALRLIALAFCTSKALADMNPEQTVWLIRDTISRKKKLTHDMECPLLWTSIINDVNPAAADMLRMTWDDELADKAQKWADNCQYAYDTKDYTPNYNSVGQNMYASDYLEDIVSNATAAWGEEKEYYHYDDNSCASGQICGHYTQVIWAKSYKLGMGVSSQKCPFGKYLVVANYAAAGNVPGESPYKMGPSASQCPRGSQAGASHMCEVTDEEELRRTIGVTTHDG